ncbi:MAG TPA: Crp/Fnr family transcriptional regulator [Hyphomicrobiaceae bacterium]|nr:Crp/Fnr family transcriptional regulator [Hyphomicrobiaceae bacterium]
MMICEAFKTASSSFQPPEGLIKPGVTINLRPRQRLALTPDAEHVYIVLKGVLLLESLPQPTTRQIIDIYYPGDVVQGALIPDVSGVNLVAARQGEVMRITLARLEGILEIDREARRWIDCALANQYSRRLLHLATIGTLSGEERVVSMLIELAYRVGTRSYEGARTFDLPLSRTDMADYLSLNADTLSRIMSRLRHSGVLGLVGRGRAYAPDFSALCQMSPVAGTINSLHSAGEAATTTN